MKNRREHARYPVSVSAEIELRGKTLEGETRDISEGGVSVLFHSSAPPEGVVVLTLILQQDGIEDPDHEPFAAPANVMWSAPSDTGATMVGLRFSKLTPAQSGELKAFLAAVARHSKA
jgi:c-di-GMP-binding flagellar brake protein YcgR